MPLETPSKAGLPKGGCACQECGHCWVLGSSQVRKCQKEPREIDLEVDRMGLNPSKSLGLSEPQCPHLAEGKYSLPPPTGAVNETPMMKCSGHTSSPPASSTDHWTPWLSWSGFNLRPFPATSLFHLHSLGTDHVLVFLGP